MAKQVSDLIVERLIEWGVDTIFGFPGDGVDGLFESLRTHQDKLRFIQVRHEEAAAFAAVGYAKYTGRLGVCCATSGPAGSTFLMDSTTPNAICSRYSPSRGTHSTISLEWITSRTSIWTSFTWTFLYSTSVSWDRHMR
ncbi:MAG: thiamine pyrophosphate-binding protein [Terracidiphilus sp.]|jgi:hypothetical protein